MKHLLLFFAFCYSAYLASAQTVKYFDVDSTQISKASFQAKSEQKLTRIIQFKNANDTIYRLEKTVDKEILPAEETAQLYLYFSTISGKQLDSRTPIVIFYHQGSDPCNLSGTATKETRTEWFGQLIKDLNRVEKTNTLVVYSIADRVDELYPNMPAYFDKYGILPKFFKNHYPCASAFILHPNGGYATIKGEYSQQMVIKMFKEAKKI